MKKPFISILFFLLLTFNLSSLSDFSFSVTPSTGILGGETDEYIFSSSDKYYVSFLEWNMESLFSVGLDLSASYKNFFAEGSFDYFLPFYCGYMYDSDYNESFKYNFCTLKNKNLLSMIGEFGIGYNFSLPYNFSISPYIQFDYNYFSFSTDKGTGYYGAAWATGKSDDVPWDDPSAKYAYQTSGIDYYFENYNLFAGFNTSWENDRWYFNLSTLISPFYYTKTLDYHRDDKDDGTDEDYHLYSIQQNFFTKFKETFTAGYKFSENLAIQLKIKLLFSSLSKGPMATDMYKDSFGIMHEEWTLTNQKAGSKINYFQSSIGVKYKF